MADDRTFGRWRETPDRRMQTPPLKLQFEGRDDWQAGLQQYLLPVGCVVDDPQAFRCSVVIGRLRDSTVAELRADPSRMVRRAPDIAAGKADFVKVLWQLAGVSRVEQGGNGAILQPGHWTVCDPAREYAIELEGGAHVLVLLQPRAQCPAWLGAMELLSGRALSGGGPAHIAAAAIGSVLRDIAYLDPESESALHDSIVTLVARALALEVESHGFDARGAKSGLLIQVQAWVLRHLGDHALTIDKVASQFGMSRRSLYNAFAGSGITPHAFIQNARLDLAGKLLGQPAARRPSVGEVGRLCGYADAAHFSRAFHAHHGVPPRAWREESL
jgi:AraC-like DNA-binding protein